MSLFDTFTSKSNLDDFLWPFWTWFSPGQQVGDASLCIMVEIGTEEGTLIFIYKNELGRSGVFELQLIRETFNKAIALPQSHPLRLNTKQNVFGTFLFKARLAHDH